jgi:hypothetical protein
MQRSKQRIYSITSSAVSSSDGGYSEAEVAPLVFL